MDMENNIMELSLENQSNRQSRAIVSIGAMVLFLGGSASAWSTCSTVARGIGMSGCGAIVVSGYSTVKYVYDRVRWLK